MADLKVQGTGERRYLVQTTRKAFLVEWIEAGDLRGWRVAWIRDGWRGWQAHLRRGAQVWLVEVGWRSTLKEAKRLAKSWTD